jgi:DNA-binding MurR/RpiR family transcriptional regulator
VTQNPNDVAMLSIGAIARRCGVHPSSLVRFAQRFGYRGFRELQAIFHTRLATAAQGFDARVDGLKAELGLHRAEGVRGFLNDLVVRDIAALEDLLHSADAGELERAVDLLAGAETIHVLGQLRSEPVALFVRYVLTMLERRVVLLDAPGGLATHVARTMTPRDVLVAVSFRFYAKEVVSIAETAHAAGVPVLAVSDSRLSPLAKSATVLFPVPEDAYLFSRSLAAPMCLAQALMIGLAARLQPDRDAAMPLVRRASDPDHEA